MANRIDPRTRLLLVCRLLHEQTDSKNALSLSSLFRQLEKEGLTAERKSVYRDMAALKKAGLDVQFRPGNEGGWHLASRLFDGAELKALADAVAVYRWLDPETREGLLDKLAALGSLPQREGLERPVSLRWYGEECAGEVRNSLDRIHSALQSERAISFVLYTHTSAGERVAEETRHIATPKGLLWAEERYHLLVWEHQSRRLCLYRVDRMGQVLVTGIPAQGEEADPAVWASVPFGLEPIRRESVQLYCRASLAGEVVDRFGPDVALHPMGDGFTVAGEVVIGPAFWGWLWSHGGDIEVLEPAWAVHRARFTA